MYKLCRSPSLYTSPDRQNRARCLIQNGTNSVEKQRANFRQEFISRLKQVRNDKLDKLRQVCEATPHLEYKSIVELRAALQPDVELAKMLDSKEILDFLERVESDIKQEEAELCETEMDRETEAIVDNLMNHCSVCETMTVHASLCESCSEEICSNFS